MSLSGLVLDLGMMSPSSSEPEEEDLASWGLARIKDAANQISESIDIPTLLLMQAAFVLGGFNFGFVNSLFLFIPQVSS